LDGTWESGTKDHDYFANLLPEGLARDDIARYHGVSGDNDFELLRLLGRDCAGALAIVPPGEEPPSIQDAHYEALTPEALARIVNAPSPLAALIEEGDGRLSFPGAQRKWAVMQDEEGLWLPCGGAASTHLLKLPSDRYKDLPLNEAFTTHVASRLGLEVAMVEPYREGCSLSARFDRMRDGSGTVMRLHQEDFCQAMGISAKAKYEEEGGPGISSAATLLREVSGQASKDILSLTRWQVVNVVIGNTDGHGKNLSLLFDADAKGIHLSPHYDMVCTRAYSGLSRNLAMKVGKVTDPGLVGRPQWKQMAEAMDVRNSMVESIVEEVATSAREHTHEWAEEFIERYGGEGIVRKIEKHVHEQSTMSLSKRLWSL
jgi:serine/threonine-protein kinase HipA